LQHLLQHFKLGTIYENVYLPSIKEMGNVVSLVAN
jgi:hypothetical protein